jgi:hypothetical protein
MLKLQNFCEKVIQDLKVLDKTSSDYQNKFLNMGQLAKSLYPSEYKDFLKTINLDNKLEQWKKISQEMLNLIEEYEINPYTKKVSVTLGGEKIINNVVDVQLYIQNTLNIERSTWQYNLTLSILAEVNTFERFQIANAIILE